MHMPVLASSTGLMVAESVVNPPAHALVSASPHALVQVYAVRQLVSRLHFFLKKRPEKKMIAPSYLA
jgi:hypothetical protein